MFCNMKRISTIALTLFLVCPGNYAHAQSDTTQVQASGFSIVEQDITLRIGESRQLHITPSTANISWHESEFISSDPIIFTDKNGLVTALRTGNGIVSAELVSNPLKNSRCNVTVIDEGSIRKDSKCFVPVDEVQESNIKFSLTNDGLFTVEGTFWGSGAQNNYLRYVITDQCIMMYFKIDYSDSTKMFYLQPFKLEIEGCNAPEYYIYMNNSVQTIESYDQFTEYSIARGTSTDGTTKTNSILFKKYDGVIYNLKGQKSNTTPETGVYIKKGNIIMTR